MLSTAQNTVLPLEPNTNTITNNSFNVAPGALNSDLLSPVQTRLQAIASSDDFFTRVLGEKANNAEIQAIRSQWAVGDFSVFPKLQILDAAVMGEAFGAYSETTQTIYLSSALLASEADDCMFGATGVLIEETFHWLDSLVGDDTPGDEGELARHLAFGVTPSGEELARIGQEQDQGLLWLNGQATPVELSSDFAGNTFATARNITLGSTPTTFRDWVGSTDTLDYYRFTLNQTSTVNFSLTGLSADAQLGLLDANGRWLAWDWRSGTASESITRELNAGTYFIEVRQGSGSTHYNLTASATPTLPTVTIAATDAEAAETNSGQTANPGRFTLTRTGSTTHALTVNYSIGGTATNGMDYTNLTGTVTFAAGSSTAFIDINPVNDTLVEPSETVILTLVNSSNYLVGTSNRATVTILDNDVLPTVTIAATDAEAAETNPGQTANPGRFTLTRTGSTSSALTVNYSIGGTATNGMDYTNLTGTVTFAAGSSTAFIDINPINDTLVEPSETVILTLVNSSNYLVGTSNRATVTILDNDVLPTVTIAATDAEAAETNPGQTPNPGRFTLTRTGSTSSALTVNYSIGGTATNGMDYTNLTGTVTFAAGSSTAVIDINPVNDTLVEPSETVILTLVNSSNYLVGTSNRATVTILDNDVLPTVTIAATDAEAAETNPGQTANPGRFTLTRTGSTSSALTVNYSIGGTATNGMDYTNLTGTVTFAAGSSTAFIDINPINDTLVEPSETVILTLVNSSNYLVGTSNRATVTILDNDVLPTVTIAATDAEAAETNSGQTPNPGRFTLTRTGSTSSALTVNYSIGGTATNGMDYTNLTGTVTFAAGSSTAFIDINPINDTLVEPSETVILTLVNSSNYLVGTSNRATVTILDNDVLPTVTIAATDAEAAETNPGQTPNPGRFTLTRTGSTSSALTVNYSIGGTATNGMDYTNLTGTVTFAAGSSTALIDINPVNDTLVEPSETVILTLVNSSNYLVGTSNRATVTILDNDVPTVIISPNIIRGTLRADTFTYTPTHARTVFIGNGNVDYGAGRRDQIDLSTVSYGTVTFNLANTNGGGVVFNPGNGNRIFDALTLNNGKEILFEGIERIRFADRTLDLSVTPNDPLFNQQWNLHMIGVHHAWRFTTGSDRVLIGVQDTGLGVDSWGNIHPDLRSPTIYPNNYRDDFFRNVLGDNYGPKNESHGTLVQGIIAAAGNNGIGMAGINWNSNVFHIDVLDNNPGDQSLAQAAQNMINEANRLGQRLVINMSLGRSSFGENLHRDLEGVVSKNPNVLFVISSGNEGHLGRSGIASPAFLASKYNNVMAVGAVHGTKNAYGQATTPGTRIEYSGWWGSQYGTGLTLMAPSEVYTTEATRNPTGSVRFSYDEKFNGTSAAAPHVTGVASLIWSVNPNLTATQVKTIMSQTAYDMGTAGYDIYYGNGVTNADAAVRRAMAMARGSA